MANANSGSMMMVVVVLLGAALSSSLAGGVGWYGYDQGWFTGGSMGASGDTTTAAPADDAKDATKSKKNVPSGTVYIYNARCKGADGGVEGAHPTGPARGAGGLLRCLRPLQPHHHNSGRGSVTYQQWSEGPRQL